MKHLLRAVAALALLTVPAIAQTLVDPTNIHMGASGATGSDPILTNESDNFTVTNISNGQAKPITNLQLIIAIPQFGNMSVGSLAIGGLSDSQSGETATTGGLVNFTATQKAGVDFLAGGVNDDLNHYASSLCNGGGCDSSINRGNIITALDGIFGNAEVTNQFLGFDVFEDLVTFAPNNSLGIGQALTVGIPGNLDSLPLGTVIAAVGESADGSPFVTSWTNTDVVNQLDVVPVPEPSSLALFGMALLGLYLVLRWRRNGSMGFVAVLALAFLPGLAQAAPMLTVTATDNGTPLVFVPSVNTPGDLVGSFTDPNFAGLAVAVTGVPSVPSPDLGTVTLQITGSGAGTHVIDLIATQSGLIQPSGFNGELTQTFNNLINAPGPATESFSINGISQNSFTFPVNPVGVDKQTFFDNGLPAITSDSQEFVATFTGAAQDLEMTQEFEAAAVPEPAPLAIFGAMLVGLGLIRRKQRGA